jgi:hypothetical protein
LSRLDLAGAQRAFLRVPGRVRHQDLHVEIGAELSVQSGPQPTGRPSRATYGPATYSSLTTARQSFVVKIVADLEKALSAPNDTLLFIEAVMDPYDAPAPVIHSSNKGAELDYGPRGPHHRDNAQLRPA